LTCRGPSNVNAFEERTKMIRKDTNGTIVFFMAKNKVAEAVFQVN